VFGIFSLLPKELIFSHSTFKAFSETLGERLDVVKKWISKSEELIRCDSKNPLLER
jgi:hypothetical protein